MTQFMDGSPVSDASNPYNKQALSVTNGGDNDILPSLDVEGVERMAMSNLDAYGSSPVTSDSAAGRPLNPPSIGGDDANP